MFLKSNKDEFYPENSDLFTENNKEFESSDDFIIEKGDKFINSFTMVYEVVMGVLNWIMKNAYLIAVIIISILFFIKLNV